MNIWKISIQNIKSKPLYTFLSIFILSLSIALLLGIQQLKTSLKQQMETNLEEIDLVIGAKGSPLQLVLASVLHVDNPTGNISYKEAKRISKNPMIKSAIPISYGDNYKSFRIIGSNEKFAALYKAKLQKGHAVKNAMEVVLGNTVAEKLRLTVGDTFLSSHGLIENYIDVHSEPFKVVGIFKPTKKVIDRLIVTNLESIWNTHNHEKDLNHIEKEHQKYHYENYINHKGEKKHEHGHENHKEEIHKKHIGHKDENHHEHNDHGNHQHQEDKHHDNSHKDENHHEHNNQENHQHQEDKHHDNSHKGENHHEHNDHGNHQHQEEHDDEKEITSLLITFKNISAFLTFPKKINKDTNMQAALPKYELDKLYDYTGAGFKTISWIAYLILLISGMTIFISLYKMVKERAFDFALLRTYGASNFQLIKMMIYEELTIVFLAFVLGFLFVKVGFYIIFNVLKINYNQIVLQDLSFLEILQTGILVLTMVILSSSLAIYPIIKMNISTILSNEK